MHGPPLSEQQLKHTFIGGD